MNTTRSHHNRAYIRHPSELPIQLHCEEQPKHGVRSLHNVSMGGLACCSEAPLQVGTDVLVKIPVVQPPFEAHGAVVWCRHLGHCYELGIQFKAREDAFAARMVEQLCYIERYRQEVLHKEGRTLDSAAAAMEWIGKFAATFPRLE